MILAFTYLFGRTVRFVSRTDRGATMVEYALLVVLVGVALIAAWTFLEGSLDSSARSSGSVMQEINSA